MHENISKDGSRAAENIVEVSGGLFHIPPRTPFSSSRSPVMVGKRKLVD